MENNFDYNSVPNAYAHCFNSQCTRSGECMRHLVAQHATARHAVLHTINPAILGQDNAGCNYFQPMKKVRLAWGFKHIFDNVPYNLALTLRKNVISCFGKTAYYRHYRQEIPLTPHDQEKICQVFRKNGITEEPVFDRYTEEYYLQ